MKRSLWVAIALLVCLGVAGWWGLFGESRKSATYVYVPVTVSVADLRDAVTVTGIVRPRNRVEVVPSIPGRVEAIFVREGQRVAAGQPIASLSSTERAALLDAARARGPDEYAHWQELYRPTPLNAPIGGVVIARNAEPGQMVGAQTPLVVIADRLVVVGQVDETDLGRVHVGQAAEVVLDAYPDEPIRARVAEIAYEAKTLNNVTIYDVTLTPDRSPPTMRAGMTATVTLTVAERQGVPSLPVTAITRRDDHAYVLVRRDDAQNSAAEPEEISVATGMSDGQRIEVQGLEPGSKVWVRSTTPTGAVPSGGNPFVPWSRIGRR